MGKLKGTQRKLPKKAQKVVCTTCGRPVQPDNKGKGYCSPCGREFKIRQ